MDCRPPRHSCCCQNLWIPIAVLILRWNHILGTQNRKKKIPSKIQIKMPYGTRWWCAGYFGGTILENTMVDYNKEEKKAWLVNRFLSNQIFIIVCMLYSTYNRLLLLLLLFYLLIDLLSLCCWIWRKMKNKITSRLLLYDCNIMNKKEQKQNGHDKNRFCN